MTESVSELIDSPSGETPSPYPLDEPDPPSYDDLQDAEAPPPPYSPSFTMTTTVNRMFDIPEAPPDYFSVVASRIQTARRETNSLSAFCAKAFRTIFFLTAVILVLVILISIPVGMLAIGAGYLGECSIEPNIPIYMIVAGICGIIKSIEALMKQIMVCSKASSLQDCLKRWKNHSKLKYFLIVWRIADVVFNLLLLGLFIAGSYWIFHVYNDLRKDGFPSSECNNNLYKISFGMMVSIYIILALTCCCVCGCALCRIKSPSDEDQPPPAAAAPPHAVLRRPIPMSDQSPETSSNHRLSNDVFSDENRSSDIYQETTEFNDDDLSVDVSLN